MAREFAKDFYNSPAWRKTRAAFISSKRGLCERCLSRGLIRPGDTVHHVRELTPDNINDPRITLSWSNLMLLCRDCHAEIHEHSRKRYTVDEQGRVTTR